MKIWEIFKEHLITRAINGSIFYTRFTLPNTDKEKYWYNRGLQDSLMDVKRYEEHCEKVYSRKYDSLIHALSSRGIMVAYDEVTNTTHLSRMDKI
jgi:hypothetical protein